ncbi:metallophosphoesterase [Archangium primigenium]|uniref:metallophosphoesterase n=1 Tax=[Archangium] primigenium TaxID=2792470 RepID=UPI00195F1E09|nr:metallophosphoesterase [Archangium primigenium]MBM7119129.1 metallophosphoesterase [Archangium primigenium]
MHKPNRLLSVSRLLGVLLVAGCGDSPETDSALPPVPSASEPTPIGGETDKAPSQPTEQPAEESSGEEVGKPNESAIVVSNCNVLPTQTPSASGDDGDGNVASHTQDDNLSTRWSALGKGVWLTLDLGSAQSLSGVAVAWHQGDKRQNQYVLSTSTDGATFTQAGSGTSALTTAAQTYAFSAARTARYVRVTVNGNTANDWGSITEARACGAGGSSTPTPTPPSSADSGPALPRQPYLQSVTTTSAIVAFRTSASCSPLVRYGEGADVSRTATATATGWQHAIKLTGLSPGRTYSYVVQACGSTTGVRSFQSATGPDTRKVRFTAMGDFGTGGSLQSKVLALLGQSSRAGEFLLTLGDNAYSSGTEAEFQSNMFKPMAALLRSTPLFTTPGNHEYITKNAQPYLDNFYLPSNNPAGSERYYSFDWGPVHFVSLDSNCSSFPTAECTKALQQAWVKQDLAATRQPWKIVFFHHPVWSSGEHGSSTSTRNAFASLFEQYGVDLVLTGHDHNYERSKPMKGSEVAASGTRGIPYLVVGSGGATLRPFGTSQPSWSAFRDNTNVGYLDVAVDGGTLTAKFISSSNVVRDSLTLTKTVASGADIPQALAAQPADSAPVQGPWYDPHRLPDFLTPGVVPPADTLESVADAPEPAQGFVHDLP